MPTLLISGQEIELDSAGFLLDPEAWTPAVAEALGRNAGIPGLTTKHWKVLSFCREEAAQTAVSPGATRIVLGTGFSLRELVELFPGAPAELAARIAGLARPEGSL